MLLGYCQAVLVRDFFSIMAIYRFSDVFRLLKRFFRLATARRLIYRYLVTISWTITLSDISVMVYQPHWSNSHDVRLVLLAPKCVDVDNSTSLVSDKSFCSQYFHIMYPFWRYSSPRFLMLVSFPFDIYIIPHILRFVKYFFQKIFQKAMPKLHNDYIKNDISDISIMRTNKCS